MTDRFYAVPVEGSTNEWAVVDRNTLATVARVPARRDAMKMLRVLNHASRGGPFLEYAKRLVGQ